MPEDILRVCTIDIGVITFTIYIEDCQLSELVKLRRKFIALPKHNQRRTKGVVTKELQTIFNEVYLCGERMFLEVTDIRSDTMKYEGKKGNGPLDVQTRLNLAAYLEEIRDVFEDVDVIRVEQQYYNTFSKSKKKGGANMNAIKLGEDLFFWLITHFPEKDIDYFGAQFKTQILGSPEKLTKPQRKKWSTAKAIEIFTLRGDEEALHDFAEGTRRRKRGEEKKKQKSDDKSDCICMCQAFKYRMYVAKF